MTIMGKKNQSYLAADKNSMDFFFENSEKDDRNKMQTKGQVTNANSSSPLVLQLKPKELKPAADKVTVSW